MSKKFYFFWKTSYCTPVCYNYLRQIRAESGVIPIIYRIITKFNQVFTFFDYENSINDLVISLPILF